MNFNEWINNFPSSPYSSISQLLSGLALVWFGIRSFVVIYAGFKKEHKEQGSLPVLAIVYMIFSIYFIWTFITNYGEITDSVKVLFTDKIGSTRKEDYYLSWFKIVFPCILLAFTLNFCKSFFTMNSLEFGYINGEDYGDLFKGKKIIFSIIDSLSRLITAYLFIYVEHEISSIKSYNNFIYKSRLDYCDYLIQSINDVAKEAVGLYVSILVWIILLACFIGKLKKVWYTLSIIQFLGGLILSISLWAFSTSFKANDNGNEYYSDNFIMSCPFILIGTFLVIILIFIIEVRSLTLKKAFVPPSLPVA